MENNYTWVTLLATDNFIGGIKILYDSLKKVNSKYPLQVIATNNLSKETFDILEEMNIPYRIFPYLSFFCDKDRNMKYWGDMTDPEENIWWNCTFAKIYSFLFTDFDKVCFLDADVVLKKNCDHYFNYPAPASYNIPSISESLYGAVFLLEPNIDTFFWCLNYGCKTGVINDEMIWAGLYPDFNQHKDHIFPEEDYCITEDRDMIKNFAIEHWDGFDKPWFNKD